MGCLILLIFLALLYAIDCLVAWGILACLAFFGVPIVVGAAQVFVGGALLLLVTTVLKSCFGGSKK